MKKYCVFVLLVFMVAGAPAAQAQSGGGSVTTGNTTIEAPVKPMKADHKSTVIEIVIAPGSFKEFSVYKGVKFQIDETKTPLNPRDSSEEWNNLELVKGNGNYLARFSNAKRTAIYAVKPVFEEQDYDNALKTFEQANAAYKQRVAERAHTAKANRALYVKDSIRNQKRIEEIAWQNILARRQQDSIRVIKETDTAVSIFFVDGYGFWKPDMAKAFNLHYITATFKTEDGEPFEPGYLALYVRGVHGCISTNADHLAVKLGADNMFLTSYHGRFAYVSFADFKKLNITADTKAQSLIMKVVDEKDNNYEYIKSLMK